MSTKTASLTLLIVFAAFMLLIQYYLLISIESSTSRIKARIYGHRRHNSKIQQLANRWNKSSSKRRVEKKTKVSKGLKNKVSQLVVKKKNTPLIDVSLKKHRKNKPVAQKKKSKLILAYTTVYGRIFNTLLYRNDQEIKRFPNPFNQCEYKCRWSTNKADYNRSDAVVFHLYNLSPKAAGSGHGEFVISKLPTRYRTDQKWVLMIREPNSFFYPQQLKLLDNKFNLSMTFQSDSDVVIPYGGYWKLSPSELEKYANIDYITGKSKMVAWLVSNCITSSRREDYVRELQKYIQVDVYGKCDDSFNSTKADNNSFILELSKHYKFYLAFENSDCDDYITEKFWRALSLGMIPIVRGRRVNYEKIAPPNS